MPRLFALALLLTACSAAPSAEAAAGECAALTKLADVAADAAATLQGCIDATPPGGTLALRPGTYRIEAPITLARPITLAPVGLPANAPACAARGDRRCPVLQVLIDSARPTTAVMPLTIRGSDVTLRHLVIAGGRLRDPATTVRLCTVKGEKRALAGGIDLAADRVTIARSVLRDFGCYTALQIAHGQDIVLADNRIEANGRHDRQDMWADGVTVHAATRLIATGNRFRDNTDVQLIFGSCADCRITGNRLTHSGSEAGGAFAGLMLHAWPGGATSGRYDGTIVSGNMIDCGAARRCGFGLLIGATPWYDAPTAGGRVIGNSVANAQLGLSVDGLTGPMEIRGNRVIGSGAKAAHTSCGPRDAAAVNVSPASRRFVDIAAVAGDGGATAESYKGCLLNFPRAVG